MKKYRKLLVACALLGFAVASGIYIQKKAEYRYTLQWYDAYDVDAKHVDDVIARKAAERLGWFSPRWSAFYLGHMAVSDGISQTDETRRQKLAEALARLERYSYPEEAISDVDFLKAGLSAMLGDKAKTLRYATEGCAAYRPVIQGTTCIATYDFGSRLGGASHSRWDAVRLYEETKALEVVGGLDRDDLRLGEAVSLIHFDITKARQLRDAMLHDGVLTGQRHDDYCRTMEYRDKDATDVQLCDVYK